MDENRELELRKTFSKLLNAPFAKRETYDYGNDKRIVYSWDEIFFELGRLTEKSNEPRLKKEVPKNYCKIF